MTPITFRVTGTVSDMRRTTNEKWDEVQKGSSSTGSQSRGVQRTAGNYNAE